MASRSYLLNVLNVLKVKEDGRLVPLALLNRVSSRLSTGMSVKVGKVSPLASFSAMMCLQSSLAPASDSVQSLDASVQVELSVLSL
jgi:hypothetical protein